MAQETPKKTEQNVNNPVNTPDDADHTEHDHSDHDHAHAHEHSDHNHAEHTHAHAEHDHAGHDHSGHGHSHDFSFESGSVNIDSFLDYFAHLAIEFSVIFFSMSVLLSLLLAYIPQKKIQAFFGASHGRGYGAAFLFAALTPLCTFSTIPMLQGLLRAQVPFGPAMTFLFCSPLLSPIILALMLTTFGLPFALFYTIMVGIFSISAGALLHYKQGQRFILQHKEHSTSAASCCSHEHVHMGITELNTTKPALKHNIFKAFQDGFKNFKQAAPYLLMGMILGALVYSFAPQSFLIEYSEDNSFISMLMAALLALPLHVHIESIIPACKVLLEKGVGLGVVMAFFVACGGVSVTGLIILKSLFKTQFLILLSLCVLGFALALGYIFPVFFA